MDFNKTPSEFSCMLNWFLVIYCYLLLSKREQKRINWSSKKGSKKTPLGISRKKPLLLDGLKTQILDYVHLFFQK